MITIPQCGIIETNRIWPKQHNFHCSGTLVEFPCQYVCANEHICYLALEVSISWILLLQIMCPKRPKYLKLSTNCIFSPLTQNSGKEVITTLDRSRGEKLYTLTFVHWVTNLSFYSVAQQYLAAVAVHAMKVPIKRHHLHNYANMFINMPQRYNRP